MMDERSRGEALHDSVSKTYALDPAETEILVEVGRLLDHINAVHAAVGGELTSTGSTGQLVAHPLLGELRAARRQLVELLAALNIPSGEEPDAYDALVAQLSRPTGGGSS